MNTVVEDRYSYVMPSDADSHAPARGSAAPANRSTRRLGWDDFAPLYDEHHERLYRIALLLCHGSATAAEDAVAETFLNVYRVWAAGEIENFMAYARRALLNHVTGQARRDDVATRYLATQSGDGRGQRTHEDALVDSNATFALLEQLAPRQRIVIVLRFYEDLSYEQIAAELGVSVGTVKSQVSTGLERLRTLMESGSHG